MISFDPLCITIVCKIQGEEVGVGVGVEESRSRVFQDMEESESESLQNQLLPTPRSLLFYYQIFAIQSFKRVDVAFI